MALPASRDEKIANFYREHAARLHRGICGKTVGLDDATVEDACATAWERLLGRPDIDLERYEAYWWLYKVALREAWALGRRQRREQPVGGLNGADEDSLEPVDLNSDVADVVAERIEHASLREVLRRPTVAPTGALAVVCSRKWLFQPLYIWLDSPGVSRGTGRVGRSALGGGWPARAVGDASGGGASLGRDAG